MCSKVEYNDYLRALCQRCWEGWEFHLPQPISEEHVSVAPEKLRRGRAGRWADEADLVPAGENLALGVNYHSWGLCNWSQTEAESWRRLGECLMTWAKMSLPTFRVWLCFIFTTWLILKNNNKLWQTSVCSGWSFSIGINSRWLQTFFDEEVAQPDCKDESIMENRWQGVWEERWGLSELSI